MNNSKPPLIVGAGPVGLAAALLLKHEGINVRIIDSELNPSPYSKALAVNPRTLELLEHTGITEEMLKRGKPIQEMHFYINNKPRTLPIKDLKHKYPFMLALSQATTESLLTDALKKLGIEIERGHRLTTCQQNGENTTVTVTKDNTKEVLNPTWLLAADGAHSTVRHELGISFEGSKVPEPWYLADVPLQNDLQQNAAHAWFFSEGGFLFLLPVVKDIRSKTEPVWRVIANFLNLFERVEFIKPSGPPLWESKFNISHRIASTLSMGNVYLAGDAAHVHSPMGARGMNLGIEDAWTFAKLLKNGNPEGYNRIRKAIDHGVVNRVETFTNLARGQSAFTRMARQILLPVLPKISLLRKTMLKTASGLDHSIKL